MAALHSVAHGPGLSAAADSVPHSTATDVGHASADGGGPAPATGHSRWDYSLFHRALAAAHGHLLPFCHRTALRGLHAAAQPFQAYIREFLRGQNARLHPQRRLHPASLYGDFDIGPVLKSLFRAQQIHPPDIVVSGGLAHGRSLSTVVTFDLVSGLATEWPGLSPPRTNHAVLGVHPFLYLLGGVHYVDEPSIPSTGTEPFQDTATVLSTVHRCDTRTGAWTDLPPMAVPRYQHSATVHGDCLVVSGGVGGDHLALASVEVFHRSTSVWSFLAPLPCPRVRHAMVSTQGELWVIGGAIKPAATGVNMPRGCHSTATVLALPSFSATWSNRPSMPTPIANPRVATYDGIVVVFRDVNTGNTITPARAISVHSFRSGHGGTGGWVALPTLYTDFPLSAVFAYAGKVYTIAAVMNSIDVSFGPQPGADDQWNLEAQFPILSELGAFLSFGVL